MNFRRITSEEIRSSLINLRQITFEVTDACNLKCKYCGYGEFYEGYDHRESKYMSFEQAKSIIDYLANLWKNHKAASYKPRTYFGFYGGEPLMNMFLIKEIISYVEQLNLNRNIVYSMTTNGMLLNKYIKYLVEKEINLLISLDGDKYAHGYRVNHSNVNSFDAVSGNIKEIQRKYPDYFTEHVNFNAVLHNRNSVEGIFRFIKNEFDKEPSISELNNSGIREDKKAEFDLTYQNKSESLLSSENYSQLSKEIFMSEPDTSNLLTYLHQYSGNVFHDYNTLFIDKSNFKYIPTGTCSPFSKKMFVTVNGKILQCERIDHNFTLGQITNNQVDLNLEQIAARFNAYLDKLQPQCAVCFRKESCIQCLYYIPGINNNQSICHGYMNKETFSRYQSQCLSHLYKNPYLYEKLMTDVMVD